MDGRAVAACVAGLLLGTLMILAPDVVAQMVGRLAYVLHYLAVEVAD